MPSKFTEFVPINVTEGVEPSTDKPSATTQHYTFTKGIRFVDGFPEKIGGWEFIDFDNSNTIDGVSRTVFSYVLDSFDRYIIGTNTRLYDLFGTRLTNITPLKTTTIAVANSLDTYYDTLGSNPIATTSGSNTIVITDTAHKFTAGDTVTLSGSSAVNGIPDTDINTDHFVRSTTANTYSVIVGTSASSTGSGGGASVVRSSGYITVNDTAHGQSDGDRVKITGAVDTGGITAAQINLEFVIRNVTTNAFDVYTLGTATSSVSGGGGASTEYQEQIDAGSVDTFNGTGYGAGLYGVGLYGVSKTSTSTTPARVWSHDRFGDLTLHCAGNDSNIYSWDGLTAEAPIVVSGAPTANYMFVDKNIVVALGADGVDNRIQWSDQGGLTDWTTGQSGLDDIEGANKFISHASARGESILFTENQCYTFRYIGGQLIWSINQLDPAIGIIAQNARVVVNGVIYWMERDNFYMWRGGNVEVVPSNTATESTILRYVFDNINYAQRAKCFAWFNKKFNEVWFHYPSSNSNEPDRIARLNVKTFSWCMDEMPRTAAEYPSTLTQNPYLINEDDLYLHETGVNDNGAGMEWQLDTNFIYNGTTTAQVDSFIVDNNMTQTATVTIDTKDYPNSVTKQTKSYEISASTGRISTVQNGRYWKYSISGDALNQRMQFGQWYQELKNSTPK